MGNQEIIWKHIAMSEHRIFSLDELQFLEKDFVQFLAANGISADYWEKLVSKNDIKVNEILEDFSSFIHQTVLEKTEILEKRTTDSLTIFFPEFDRLHFIRIENNVAGIFDFEKQFDLDDFQNFLLDNTSKISVFKGEKSIKVSKANDFLELLKSGCKISKNTALLSIMKHLITKPQNVE